MDHFQRLKANLEIAFVGLLVAANAGVAFLTTVTLAARGPQTFFAFAALCGLFVFHFVLHCVLLGRFLALIDLGDPYEDDPCS